VEEPYRKNVNKQVELDVMPKRIFPLATKIRHSCDHGPRKKRIHLFNMQLDRYNEHRNKKKTKNKEALFIYTSEHTD
jgi:hypothetical protein